MAANAISRQPAAVSDQENGSADERGADTPKKKLIRRTERDYSQVLRRSVQAAFVILNIWIGVEFYLWVRAFEHGAEPAPARPAGVEGWLPIAGLMNLKAWLLTGRVPELHAAGMFLLVAFLGISLVFRKAFCSWLCPIGTLSEYLWKAGKKLFRRNLVPPRWLDFSLRGLKYLLLAFFALAVVKMPADEIASFMRSPFGTLADVQMLNFFRTLTTAGAAVLLLLVVFSVFVQNFWCRYLCPYGALMGLAALASPLRIRRVDETCIDCAKCAKACPSHLPVDKLVQIRSAECTACMECVAVCPAENTLFLAAPAVSDPTQAKARLVWGTQPAVPAWAVAAGIALIFFGTVGYARVSGHWQTKVPNAVYRTLIPHANEIVHPMP
jgi:polyferredoxin